MKYADSPLRSAAKAALIAEGFRWAAITDRRATELATINYHVCMRSPPTVRSDADGGSTCGKSPNGQLAEVRPSFSAMPNAFSRALARRTRLTASVP